MRFQSFSLLALAGLGMAKSWAGKNLPDGSYDGIVHPDGSVTFKSADSSESFTFDLVDDDQSDHLGKRSTSSCYGDILDHEGVVVASNKLRSWAGAGHELTSGDTTAAHIEIHNGVQVYYCVNAPNSSGNLNVEDINFALYWMDQDCIPFEASHFWWPDNSIEIVGKAGQTTPICLG
ncbi:hypothetical protein FQN54_003146 [Arachnomyces sp. PD_36]|nr:hypothetical protein FQN54_003146 [Arachnomyces sp. PD_36]